MSVFSPIHDPRPIIGFFASMAFKIMDTIAQACLSAFRQTPRVDTA